MHKTILLFCSHLFYVIQWLPRLNFHQQKRWISTKVGGMPYGQNFLPIVLRLFLPIQRAIVRMTLIMFITKTLIFSTSQDGRNRIPFCWCFQHHKWMNWENTVSCSIYKNAIQEQNNGMDIGWGLMAQRRWVLNAVKLRQQFVTNPPNFSTYDQVLMIDFQDDERDLAGDAYDLFQLKKTFKQAINFPENFNRVQYRIQQAIRTATPENFSRLKNFVNWQIQRDSTLLEDDIIKDFIALETLEVPADLKTKSAFILREYNFDVEQLERFLGDLREVKTPFELNQLKRAIEISAIGQVEVMKAIHPQMSEREVQGIHEYVFKKYGAAYEGLSVYRRGREQCLCVALYRKQ